LLPSWDALVPNPGSRLHCLACCAACARRDLARCRTGVRPSRRRQRRNRSHTAPATITASHVASTPTIRINVSTRASRFDGLSSELIVAMAERLERCGPSQKLVLWVPCRHPRVLAWRTGRGGIAWTLGASSIVVPGIAGHLPHLPTSIGSASATTWPTRQRASRITLPSRATTSPSVCKSSTTSTCPVLWCRRP
jgi:hypothetical protein